VLLCETNYRFNETGYRCEYFVCSSDSVCNPEYDEHRTCSNQKCVCSHDYKENYMNYCELKTLVEKKIVIN
jgi:hypothetical protein